MRARTLSAAAVLIAARIAAIFVAIIAASAAHSAPAIAGPDPVQASELRTEAGMQIWAYASTFALERESVLNPDNAIAHLPSSQRLLDARINMQVRDDTAELVLQPRLLAEHHTLPSGSDSEGTAYLSQGFVRVRPDQRVTLSGGRYRLTWGPANFRSPSNPFYFDSGKNQPLRDVPGVDLLRVDYTLRRAQLTAAYIADAGYLAGRPDIDDVSLLKADYHGRDWMASTVGTARSGGKPFFGAFAQYPVSDALMLYAEYGHGQRAFALTLPSAVSGTPVIPRSPSGSASSALLGGAYTLLNGQVISVEYLYDGHGYPRQQEARYFDLAEQYAGSFLGASGAADRRQAAAALGQLISHAPALMGRHYAYLLWQSNPQESSSYWRAALARNLRDGSSQALLYAEKNVSQRVTLFASAMINHGGTHSEFGAITSRAVSAGLKLFVF